MNDLADEKTPVLIVGGGGAGLTASMLLAGLGVESLLVSALPTTSLLPKAHVLNQRAMEILADCGVADEIEAQGTPRENMRATAFYAGLAGPSPDHGRRLHRLECWGAGYTDEDWVAASPRAQSNLPQIRLEPILKRRAEELSPGRVRFHHEVVGFEQDDRGALATVRDHAAGRDYRVRADWVLACDGGRKVGSLVGIELEGARGLAQEISIHLAADLSRWARDPDVLIRWIWLPESGRLAVLVPMGPKRWGPDSEEWVFHLNYPAGHSEVTDEQALADMRASLGIGDHPVRVHKVSRWSLDGVVASRFRSGRTFVLGDAAHRHPPTGGLGLTSAIHDAQNMCWKIAAVVKGQAGERLLDSYEPERKPADACNVQRSVENALNHFAILQAAGLSEQSSAEENWARLRRLWSGRPEDEEFRVSVLYAFASQSMEFREHAVEYGVAYESGAVVPDGTPPPSSPDPVRLYHPSTRPGHPLPHARIEDLHGRALSTIDLVRPGRFLLVAGEDGQPWCEAARAIGARAGIPIDAVRIGHLGGDLLDPRCHWLRHRGIAADGAILVRPDRHVCWRSTGAAADPSRVLSGALARVLDRELAA
ncbi:FAD-dependent monooxygenase [bacterium]|nr:FAD-dependent monooxygenase [bacterium]